MGDLWDYATGRTYSLGLNYRFAYRYFEAITSHRLIYEGTPKKDPLTGRHSFTLKARRREHAFLTGLILNDWANVHYVIGDMDEAKKMCQLGAQVYQDALSWPPVSAHASLRMGIARALAQEQEVWCHEDAKHQGEHQGEHMCHEFHLMVKAELERMENEAGFRQKDWYSYSKSERAMAWCAMARGMSAMDRASCRQGLKDAEAFLRKSYSYAQEIRTDSVDPWWLLRDGPDQLGGPWRKLVTLVAWVDVLSLEDKIGEAREKYAESQVQATEFRRMRFAPDIPPLAPVFEWRLGLADDDKLEDDLKRRLEETRARGNLLYLPLMHVSYGDFLLERMRHRPGSKELAMEQYKRATHVPPSSRRIAIQPYYRSGLFSRVAEQRRKFGGPFPDD